MSRSHLGAALVMSAVLAAGAATAQTTTGSDGSDSSATLQDRIEQTQQALEAERERRRAQEELSRELREGNVASESWLKYRQRQQQNSTRQKQSGTMFYQQQMNK